MKFIENINISNDKIKDEISKYINVKDDFKLLLKQVYYLDKKVWTPLIGNITIHNDGVFSPLELSYPDFKFRSVILDFTSLDALISKLVNEGIMGDFQHLPIKCQGNNWNNILIPTNSGSSVSLRSFNTKIGESNRFYDDPLIGFNLPFYSKASDLITEFLDMKLFSSSSDSTLSLRIPDKRGKLLVKSGELLYESDEECSIVGVIENSDTKTRVSSIHNNWNIKEIDYCEIYLVNKNHEVLDFIQSHHFEFGIKEITERVHDEDELCSIIDKGETEYCEFKKYIGFKDDKKKELDKTVCAFSNNAGGTLFIGINDEAEVIGVRKDIGKEFKGDITAYIKAIEKHLTETLQFNTCFEITAEDIRGQEIIVIKVSKAPSCNQVISDNLTYIRKGASSVKARTEDIIHLSKKNNTLKLDPDYGESF